MRTRSVRDHRDLAAQAGSVSHRQTALPEPSQHGIDVDGRIVIAHESLALDTGGHSARWRRVRSVCLGEFVDSGIGDLPDRAVIPPRRSNIVIPNAREAVLESFASVQRTSLLISLVTTAF
jgi:hypothetical protein